MSKGGPACCGDPGYLTVKKFNGQTGEFIWERDNLQQYPGDVCFDGHRYVYVPFVRDGDYLDYEEIFGKLTYPTFEHDLNYPPVFDTENISGYENYDPRYYYTAGETTSFTDGLQKVAEIGFYKLDALTGATLETFITHISRYYGETQFTTSDLIKNGAYENAFFDGRFYDEGVLPLTKAGNISNYIGTSRFAGNYALFNRGSDSGGLSQTDFKVLAINAADPTQITKKYILSFPIEKNNVSPNRPSVSFRFVVPAFSTLPEYEFVITSNDSATDIENLLRSIPQIDTVEVTGSQEEYGYVITITWADISIVNFKKIERVLSTGTFGVVEDARFFIVDLSSGSVVFSYFNSNYPDTFVGIYPIGFGNTYVYDRGSGSFGTFGSTHLQTCADGERLFLLNPYNNSAIPPDPIGSTTQYPSYKYWWYGVDSFLISSNTTLEWSYNYRKNVSTGPIHYETIGSRNSINGYNVSINDNYFAVIHETIFDNLIDDTTLSGTVLDIVNGGLNYYINLGYDNGGVSVNGNLVGQTNTVFIRQTTEYAKYYLLNTPTIVHPVWSFSKIEKVDSSTSSSLFFTKNIATISDPSVIGECFMLSDGDNVLRTGVFDSYYPNSTPAYDQRLVATNSIRNLYSVQTGIYKSLNPNGTFYPPLGSELGIPTTLYIFNFYPNDGNVAMSANSRFRLVINSRNYQFTGEWMDNTFTYQDIQDELNSVFGNDSFPLCGLPNVLIQQESDTYFPDYVAVGGIDKYNEQLWPALEALVIGFYVSNSYDYISVSFINELQNSDNIMYFEIEEDQTLSAYLTQEKFTSEELDIQWSRNPALFQQSPVIIDRDIISGEWKHTDELDGVYFTGNAPTASTETIVGGYREIESAYTQGLTLNEDSYIYTV